LKEIKFGITKYLLRLSVGIEDADDLIKDLSNSLEING
jgi:Cystathionine beta-lyases/cystathionine gamma-synthases